MTWKPKGPLPCDYANLISTIEVRAYLAAGDPIYCTVIYFLNEVSICPLFNVFVSVDFFLARMITF